MEQNNRDVKNHFSQRIEESKISLNQPLSLNQSSINFLDLLVILSQDRYLLDNSINEYFKVVISQVITPFLEATNSEEQENKKFLAEPAIQAYDEQFNSATNSSLNEMQFSYMHYYANLVDKKIAQRIYTKVNPLAAIRHPHHRHCFFIRWLDNFLDSDYRYANNSLIEKNLLDDKYAVYSVDVEILNADDIFICKILYDPQYRTTNKEINLLTPDEYLAFLRLQSLQKFANTAYKQFLNSELKPKLNYKYITLYLKQYLDKVHNNSTLKELKDSKRNTIKNYLQSKNISDEMINQIIDVYKNVIAKGFLTTIETIESNKTDIDIDNQKFIDIKNSAVNMVFLALKNHLEPTELQTFADNFKNALDDILYTEIERRKEKDDPFFILRVGLAEQKVISVENEKGQTDEYLFSMAVYEASLTYALYCIKSLLAFIKEEKKLHMQTIGLPKEAIITPILPRRKKSISDEYSKLLFFHSNFEQEQPMIEFRSITIQESMQGLNILIEELSNLLQAHPDFIGNTKKSQALQRLHTQIFNYSNSYKTAVKEYRNAEYKSEVSSMPLYNR